MLMNTFLSNIITTLNSENKWEDILTDLSEKLMNFIAYNRDVPLFLVNELHKNPDFFAKQLLNFKDIKNSFFFSQLKKEMENGNIINTDPLQILVHIFSGIMYPVIAEPILSAIGDFKTKDFDKFMLQRKKIVPETIIQYLKNTGANNA